MADRISATKRLGYYFARYKRLVLQNYPHDQRVYAQSGVDLPIRHVFDTMSGAYHDGRLPHGLKPMSYKLLGVKGDSFDDIVEPYGYELALDYIAKAICIKWPKPEQESTGEITTRNCPDCKGKGVLTVGRGQYKRSYTCDGPDIDGQHYYCDRGKITVSKMTRKQGMNEKLSRLIMDLGKGKVKIWERWAGWELDVLPLIAKIGPIPIPSIDQVPKSIVTKYAAGDAIKTWRVYHKLRERLVKIRRSVR